MTERVVLVTGASRGLGRAIALRLARAGDHVLIGYRQRRELAEHTHAAIQAMGGRSEILGFDIRDADACERALGPVRARLGPITVLVNNAAVADEGMFAFGSATRSEEVLGVGLHGTLHCSRVVVRDMLLAGGGAIVNVSSVMTRRGQPGQVAYTTAKGAVEAFTRALALELAPRQIRVNAAVAGLFDTGMTQLLDRATRERWESAIPIGRLGRTEEFAETVAWLCSSGASYVTGHCLVADGGLSL